ncbi:heavy metal-associated isoprenylated plant protein 3 isoform X2 [Capsicum galapagoense]
MNPTVGAFLNVLFERIPSWVELLKKNKHGDRLLEKLEDILLGLQIERSDAENKQASDPLVRKWLNKLQRAVDDDENLLEEVNYEALRLKVEGQLRNLEEKSNQQVSYVNLSLSDDFFLNIKEKLEDTIETLELLEKQIGRLGLQKHLDSGKKSTKKNEEGEKKKKEGGEENKKDGGNLTAILKSCQCEGCVSTVVKAIRSIGGVEKVMCDVDSKKLTVIGKVDPVMLREEVERKTQKNVEVVSPITKKDGKGKKGGDNGSDNGAGEEKKKMQKQNKEKDSRENTGGEVKKTKEKELPITTAVLKLHCHCQGCIQKIDEIVTKFKGYKEMKVD